MRALESLITGISIVGGILIAATKVLGDTPDGNTARVVKCCDIPTNVTLVGRLGTRLGQEVIIIRGKWKEPENTKEDEFKFVVTTVGGKEVRPPVEIPWTSIEPVALRGDVTNESDGSRKWVVRWNGAERLPPAFPGDEWEMVGFETGHIAGWPLEIRRIFWPRSTRSESARYICHCFCCCLGAYVQ